MRPLPAKIDMEKVHLAVLAYGSKSKPPVNKGFRELPLKPSPIAQDAAIRKPLKSHGCPCSGWNCQDFLHNDR